MRDIDYKIEVMQAYKDGKKIEYVDIGHTNWTVVSNPIWDWMAYDYRVKRGPREFWINVYDTWQVAHLTKESANNEAGPGRLECIHVREVQ